MKQEKKQEELYVINKAGKKVGKLVLDNQPEEVPQEEERMLTRKEVMEILKISYPTAVRWDRKGVLNPVVFPGTKKVLYRKSDIDRLVWEREE